MTTYFAVAVIILGLTLDNFWAERCGQKESLISIVLNKISIYLELD